jgi:hypothetical protein
VIPLLRAMTQPRRRRKVVCSIFVMQLTPTSIFGSDGFLNATSHGRSSGSRTGTQQARCSRPHEARIAGKACCRAVVAIEPGGVYGFTRGSTNS